MAVADKPVSTATQTQIDTKVTEIIAGTNVTVDRVGNDVTVNSTATGTGDVVGPAAAVVDSNLPAFDTTTGKLLKDSLIAIANIFTLDGTQEVTGDKTLSGDITITELGATTPGIVNATEVIVPFVDGEGFVGWAGFNAAFTPTAGSTGITPYIDNLYKVLDGSIVGIIGEIDDTAASGDTTVVLSAGKTIDLIDAVAVGAPVTTYPTYSDETCTKGQYAYGTSPAPKMECRDTDTWDYLVVSGSALVWAGWDNPTPTIPTMTSATIPTSGDTVSLLFSEAITIGSGGNAGWTLNTPTNAMTYSSGDTTNTLVYALASTINSTDTPTITYVQPGEGLESSTGGDLASITAGAVVNNSTQGGATTYFVGLYNDHTTTMVTTAPGSSSALSSFETLPLDDPTLPAGSTVVAIHVYMSDLTTPGSEQVNVYTFAPTGARLATAVVTSVLDTWTRSSVLAGSQTYFASETQVYFGYVNNGTESSIGRDAAAGSTFKDSFMYDGTNLTTPTASTNTWALILEYTL